MVSKNNYRIHQEPFKVEMDKMNNSSYQRCVSVVLNTVKFTLLSLNEESHLFICFQVSLYLQLFIDTGGED